MTTHQSLVAEFMRVVAGQEVHSVPTLRDAKTHALQFALMREEAIELYTALIDQDRIAIADACGDLLYVAYNAANAHGLEVLPRFGLLDGASHICAYTKACNRGDLEGIKYELASVAGCAINAAVNHNIPLYPVFCEIHRSNMTKLWTYEEVQGSDLIDALPLITGLVSEQESGYKVEWIGGTGRCYRVKNAAGKLLKSPSYEPANLKPILEAA